MLDNHSRAGAGTAAMLLVGLCLGLTFSSMFDAHRHSNFSVRVQSPVKLTLPISSLDSRGTNLTGTDSALFRLLRSAADFSPAGFNNTVAVVEVNQGFLPFAFNLHKQLQMVVPPLSNIVWVALDEKAAEELRARLTNALVFYDPADSFHTGAVEYRNPDYNRIVKHKWTLLHRVMLLGFDVLIMDVDFAVLRNPFLYFQTMQPLCDFVFYDNLIPTIQDDKLWLKRDQPLAQIDINTGFLLFRTTPSTKALVQGFIKAPARAGIDDQALFNEFLQQHVWSKTPESLRLPVTTKATKCAQWSDTSVQVLPPGLFGSWRHYFYTGHGVGIDSWTQETPYAIHYNWVIGFAAKKSKMVEHGYWLID